MTATMDVNMKDLFDPLGELFIAQFAKPEGLERVNLRALTPFQRALLVIDGTVTKFIEAYTLEPVEIVRLKQAMRTLSAEEPWLEAPAGTAVIARQALLRGEYSHTFYGYAVSLIQPDRLPDNMKRELDEQGGAIGRILLASGAETRREILWYGKEHVTALPDVIRRVIDNNEFLSRTYRIIVAGKPIMLINERFPFNTVRFPAHH